MSAIERDRERRDWMFSRFLHKNPRCATSLSTPIDLQTGVSDAQCSLPSTQRTHCWKSDNLSRASSIAYCVVRESKTKQIKIPKMVHVVESQFIEYRTTFTHFKTWRPIQASNLQETFHVCAARNSALTVVLERTYLK